MTELIGAVEVGVGAALIALGLVMLVSRLRLRRHHRRFDVLALLLAIVALVEARKRPTDRWR